MKDTALIKNRYRLREEIGQGGMGVVYKVEDTLKDNMVFALKTIRQEVIKKHRTLSFARFKNEYEIMTRLKHPNLTRVYGFGEDHNNYYIIMEYLEGTLLSGMKSSYEKALEIIVQILRVLEYIHSRNIVYRDIKPSNIMLTGDMVKLMDFGLSSFIDKREDKVQGTLFYMAPEALKKEMNFSSDIFSLGILFYELCTDFRFFECYENSYDMLIYLMGSYKEYDKYQNSVLRNIKDISLGKIIRKMTSFCKKDRYESCSEIIYDINNELGFNFEYETRDTKISYVLGNAFTDRHNELKSLIDHLTSMQSDKFFVCRGSSGAGKTRLFFEFKKYCNLNGIPFFETNCMEGRIRAYHSVIEILSQMAVLCSGSLLLRYGKFLRLLLPNNYKLQNYEPPNIRDKPDILQKIIIINITDFIIEFSRSVKNKVILYFNDFQWIDYGSLLIVKNLLGRLGSVNDKVPVLQYANINDDEDINFKDFLNTDKIVGYELCPFDLEGVYEYIENVFGAHCLDESIKNAVSEIKAKVGSSPLFLQELVKSLLEKGIIVKDKRYWKLLKPIEDRHIPSNILDIIQHKLDILFEDENKRRILRLLSLFRIDLNISTIKAIINKIASVEAAMVLLELENLEIIQADTIDNIVYYAFNNSIIKNKIRESIKNKQEIHLFIAESLESMPNAGNIDLTEETAYHYMEGQNPKKAIFYYEKCGDNAKDSYFADKAIYYYQTALDLSKDKDTSAGNIAEIKLKIADQTDIKNNWNDARAIYQQILKNAELINNIELITECCYRIGRIMHKQGDSEQAKVYYNKSLKLAYSNDNRKQIARNIAGLGIIYYDEGDYQKSMEYYEKSLKIYDEIGDKDGIGRCYNSMGNLYWSICSFEKAMEYYVKNLSICEELGDKYGMGNVFCNIGNACWSLGDYDKSLKYYNKALEISQELGDKYGTAVDMGNIGVFYYYTGDYERAMELYVKSLALYEEVGHKKGTIYSYGNIGLIYHQQKDYPKALEYIEKAIQISRELKIPYTLCDQLFNKANLLYDINEDKKSQVINNEALKIAINIKRDDIIYKCRILKNKLDENEAALLEMLSESGINEEQTAGIYYNLWKLTKKKQYHKKAKDIYRKMLNEFSKIEYKQRIQELDSDLGNFENLLSKRFFRPDIV